MTPVIVRFAPSPTGPLHVGGARTALFNYLFAKQNGGQIFLRLEDTDRERSKPEFEQNIIESLDWLDLKFDNHEPIRQSERPAIYREALEKIILSDTAYVSKEKVDETHKRGEVIRLRNSGRKITFTDLVRGEISFDTTELGDFVIAKGLDEPLYHFAVVVDDWRMNITHVIRGEDHISNTPRQILIQEALGAPRPVYAHIPLILDAKRAKLSKRSGATSVVDYRAEGFLPEALVNYFALLGWSPDSDREDFSLAELVDAFTLEGVQKGGAAFDKEKLFSVNQRWMRKLSNADFLSQLRGFVNPSSDEGFTKPLMLAKIVPLLKERARTFGEAREMLEGELAFLFKMPELARETLLAKEPAGRPGVAKYGLEATLEGLEGLADDVSSELAKDTLMPIANAAEAEGKGGRGAVLWPLRYALSGQERSPDPFTIISILGTEEVISRIHTALAILGG